MILKILLFRENIGLKKIFQEPDFKLATKDRAFSKNLTIEMKNEKDQNLFLNENKEKIIKKFSCFRFDFMPNRPCYTNG